MDALHLGSIKPQQNGYKKRKLKGAATPSVFTTAKKGKMAIDSISPEVKSFKTKQSTITTSTKPPAIVKTTDRKKDVSTAKKKKYVGKQDFSNPFGVQYPKISPKKDDINKKINPPKNSSSQAILKEEGLLKNNNSNCTLNNNCGMPDGSQLKCENVDLDISFNKSSLSAEKLGKSEVTTAFSQQQQNGSENGNETKLSSSQKKKEAEAKKEPSLGQARVKGQQDVKQPAVEPAGRKRRLASLTAQTRMHILNEKLEPKSKKICCEEGNVSAGAREGTGRDGIDVQKMYGKGGAPKPLSANRLGVDHNGNICQEVEGRSPPAASISPSKRTASLNALAILQASAENTRREKPPPTAATTAVAKAKKARSPTGKPALAGKQPAKFLLGLGATYIMPQSGATVVVANAASRKPSPGSKAASDIHLYMPTPTTKSGKKVARPTLLPKSITLDGIGSISSTTAALTQWQLGRIPVAPVPVDNGFFSSGSGLYQPDFSTKEKPKSGKQPKIKPKLTKPVKAKACKIVQRSEGHKESSKVVLKPLALKKKKTNGWKGVGDPFEKPVFLSNDSQRVIRKCYSAIKRKDDVINVRDCVLLKSGYRKKDLPFVAKIASFWEDPDEGDLWMSILWYYRPEHIESGRKPNHARDEIFACKHLDHNSVACIEDICYVLPLKEYNRFQKKMKMYSEGRKPEQPVVPPPHKSTKLTFRSPPVTIDKELVFLCRHVYDFKLRRILKNPS